MMRTQQQTVEYIYDEILTLLKAHDEPSGYETSKKDGNDRSLHSEPTRLSSKALLRLLLSSEVKRQRTLLGTMVLLFVLGLALMIAGIALDLNLLRVGGLLIFYSGYLAYAALMLSISVPAMEVFRDPAGDLVKSARNLAKNELSFLDRLAYLPRRDLRLVADRVELDLDQIEKRLGAVAGDVDSVSLLPFLASTALLLYGLFAAGGSLPFWLVSLVGGVVLMRIATLMIVMAMRKVKVPILLLRIAHAESEEAS